MASVRVWDEAAEPGTICVAYAGFIHWTAEGDTQKNTDRSAVKIKEKIEQKILKFGLNTWLFEVFVV